MPRLSNDRRSSGNNISDKVRRQSVFPWSCSIPPCHLKGSAESVEAAGIAIDLHYAEFHAGKP